MTRLTLLFLLLATPALAQPTPPPDDAPPANVRYKDVTNIDIEDVRVGGEIKGPLGHFGLEKRRATFNPLLTLREDFNREMIESVNKVR